MKNIVFGIHTLFSILENNYKIIDKVFINNNYFFNKRLKILFQELKENNIPINIVKRKYLDKISKNSLHQGIIAQIKPFKYKKEDDLKYILLNKQKKHFFLILDSITDPHNFGAILRNANAAGVQAVIIPKNRSAGLDSVARKVSSGAAENIPIIKVTNLSRTIKLLKLNNIFVIGSSKNSKNNLFTTKLSNSIAVVIGSEHKGLRKLTSKNCDLIIHIPMFGKISSLNASVASGIILFEIVRQRINL